MIKPEILDAMLASGCTAEQIVAAVKASMTDRTKNAARQARYRERHVTSRNVTERNETLPTPSPLVPPDKDTPTPLEINPPIIPPTPKTASEFADWYSRYPNKVGKPEAQRAFAKARTKTSLESLNDGLTRYLAKTDDRPWCNPATWLNQERWTDEPAQVARGSPRQPRPDPVRNVIANLLDQMEPQNAEPAAQIERREPSPRLLSPDQFR